MDQDNEGINKEGLLMDIRFLKLKDVKDITSLSATSIYREMAKGKFPKKIQLTQNRGAWLESEVIDYLESKIAARS
jgi:prophage regulatory protein